MINEKIKIYEYNVSHVLEIDETGKKLISVNEKI